MNIEEERKAFEEWFPLKHLFAYVGWSDSQKNYVYNEYEKNNVEAYEYINASLSAWQAAKAHEAKKLEGCVVVNSESLLFHAQSIRMFNNGDWENVCQEIEEHVCAIETMLEAARGGK